MIFIFSFIILIINIKSRIYENIFELKDSIISNVTKINFSVIIKGTNDFEYKFETKNIIFKLYKNDLYANNTIILHKPIITILFNFSIYEKNKNIFDIEDFDIKSDIINNTIISANINFDSITYYQSYKDFSFDMKYKIKDLKNNIKIQFDNLEQAEFFKYLIFNEENILYNNKTLYEYLKEIILDNLLQKMYNNLLFYPECDALYYFKKLYEYFYLQDFGTYIDCLFSFYYSGKVESFYYDKLTRNNGSINFTNVKSNISYAESTYNDEKNDDNTYYNWGIFELKYFQINEDLEPEYGPLEDEYGQLCFLNLFKDIFNKSQSAISHI